MTGLRLFATMQDRNGGLAQIYCDGRQHFVFERWDDGVVCERTFSSDPRDFHDYIKTLGGSGWRTRPAKIGSAMRRRTDLADSPTRFPAAA